MTPAEETNLATIRAYLTALESGAAGEALRHFFAAEVQQIELPNLLNPKGQQSDLANILTRSEQGLKVLRQQRYTIASAIAQDDRIAIEAQWTGVLAIPLGTLSPGDEMRADLAVFFQLRDGKIILQRNYDCFEAW